jgi:hypothetical protein
VCGRRNFVSFTGILNVEFLLDQFDLIDVSHLHDESACWSI